MTSAVSLGLLVVLEAQTYHSFYRSGTNRSRFLVVFNILHYFVHQRLLVPFGLGVLLSCMLFKPRTVCHFNGKGRVSTRSSSVSLTLLCGYIAYSSRKYGSHLF